MNGWIVAAFFLGVIVGAFALSAFACVLAAGESDQDSRP